MVAGFGSGKTEALIVRALRLKLQYPECNVGYYLPTYDLVTTVGFARFEEKLTEWGLKYGKNKNDKMIHVQDCGAIIFRTMDAPDRIVGYEVADSLVDELDTLPVDKARNAWNKIIGRNRQKKLDGSLNTVAVGTTPEGFRFVYEKWGKTTSPLYRLIRASTYSNAHNLPDGYIEALKDTYSSALLAAYLDGYFVNLTSGSVYVDFDRTLNASHETIQSGDPLHVGMDFNVGKMSAILHVLRNDDPHAAMEHTGVLDTPTMADLLKSRYPNHKIIVYPDANGQSRKSNGASESDIAILKGAGFVVRKKPSNPRVKDRVLAMNRMIHNQGERRYRVNPDTCPDLVESLEKQAYDKNGEPDKSGDLDHCPDAAGYFISYRYPVRERPKAINLGFASR